MPDGSCSTGWTSHGCRRIGDARRDPRTHQIPQPFERLTVFENVLVGVRFGRTSEVADANRTAMEMMERARLDDRPNVLAGSLTLLQRKRLELARALPRSHGCCCSTSSPVA